MGHLSDDEYEIAGPALVNRAHLTVSVDELRKSRRVLTHDEYLALLATGVRDADLIGAVVIVDFEDGRPRG